MTDKPKLTPDVLALLDSVHGGEVYHLTCEWTGRVTDERVDSMWGVAPETTDVTARIAVLQRAGWAEVYGDKAEGEKWQLTEAGRAVYDKAQAALSALAG